MTDVGAWLQGLGLGQYEAAFRDNGVDASVLPELTAEDLKEMGVAAVGHRRKLLAAIAALRGPPPAGAPAAEPPSAATPAGDAFVGHGAERRQLTVVFCDLAGSTALSARLDPEDLREVMAVYHRAVAEVIERHGGYVAKLLGDGVLAYFGWPEAHEDAAERAVRAGLAAADAVARLEVPGAGRLAARVGLATGPVVVGEVLGRGEARERGVVGETPNLAARLQALAEPGAVVADAATRRLTGALFAWADLGGTEVKGLPGPVRTWRALGESGVESRFEALRAGHRAAPLVGREEELELLLRRWRRARSGAGQVALLRGEAGIGKSRLVAALQEMLAAEEHEGFALYSSPQHTDSALRPVSARLERAAGLAPGEAPEARLSKLEALLLPLDPPPEDVALVADLLSVPTLGRWPALDLSPQLRRTRLLGALLRRIRMLAARGPVLAVVEDAHWLDPTTRELLDLLVAEAPAMAALVVVTHRPEFDASAWIGASHVALLQLNRLAPADNAALLRRVAGGKALPPEVEAEVLARTDGVPLFVEEVGRAVLEGGLLREEADRWALDGAPPQLAVPASLQASLVARLDRLSSAREAAQVGAAIGREFAHDLVAAASGLPERRLRKALEHLAAADLVQRRGAPPDAVYAFKHALIQDAAYGTLLREHRRALHARIAGAIERLRPDMVEREPHVIARHLGEAGNAEAAIDHWLRAAELAQGRGATAEAEAALGRGLDLLPQVAETTDRLKREADLRLARGKALFASRWHGTPEAGTELQRALEAAQQAGDPDRHFRVLSSQWVHLHVAGRLRDALGIAERVLSSARARGDAAGQVMGQFFKGLGLLATADMSGAEASLRTACELASAVRRREDLFAAGFDAALGAEAYLSVALLQQGRPDAAISLARKLVDDARARSHPFTRALVYSVAIRCAAWAGDDGARRAWQREAHDLADEKGFGYYLHLSRLHGRILLARDGRPDGGCAALLDEFAEFRAGAGDWLAVVHGRCVAECLMDTGHHREALALVEHLVSLADTIGESETRPDLLRLHGALAARAGDSEAEQWLIQALEAARDKSLRWWELRAARDLARLWRDQGRVAEARALLAPVYAAFTEGFALRDMVEARALLEELGAAPADGADRRQKVRTPPGPDRLREPAPGR